MGKNTKMNIWKNTQKMLENGEKFNSLTIERICRESNIHRSTFYRLFMDKFNLLEFGIDLLWEEFFENTSVLTLKEPFSTAATFLENSDAQKIIIAQKSDLFILHQIKIITFRKLKSIYSVYLKSNQQELLSGYILSCIDYIDDYCNNSVMSFSVKEKDALFKELVLDNTNIGGLLID